ncbi:MAG: pilus assembly protein [Lentisphaerae bacterium]|nr:pilus assembly protein [Lentisphaerota bacterium]
MKRPFQIWSDESAQALTEFAVVGPIVFFIFFASFQFIAMWNVQMMVDYAAFCAARSIAVQEAHIGPAAAGILARAAASVALMPVSKPVKGEAAAYLQLLGGGSVLSALKSKAKVEQDLLMALGRSLNQVTGDGNSNAKVLEKMSWLLTAWGRINVGSPPTALSYGKQSAGGLTEVSLELRYDYPLFIPGFAEFWNYLTGTPMENAFTRKSAGIPFFFQTLRSKCAVGYEDFSRNFENNPHVNNPYADRINSVDQDRINQLNKEIAQLQQEFQQAKSQHDSCGANSKSMGFATVGACQAFYKARMDDLSGQIDAKRAELDALMPNF